MIFAVLRSSLRFFGACVLRLFFGRVGGNLYRKEMSSPEIEPAEGADRIRPIYPQTHGLNS